MNKLKPCPFCGSRQLDDNASVMYDELIERLRAKSYTLEELSIILPRAADVIEELLPFKKQVEKGMGLLDKADELLNKASELLNAEKHC